MKHVSVGYRGWERGAEGCVGAVLSGGRRWAVTNLALKKWFFFIVVKCVHHTADRFNHFNSMIQWH